MTSRAEIENLVNRSYESRSKNDVVETIAYFDESCSFRIMGNDTLGGLTKLVTSRAELEAMIRALTGTWDLSGMRTTNLWIDGNTAIVRRAGAVRHIPSNRVFDTVILDVMTIDHGKIVHFEEYADTHLVAMTLGGSAGR